jgi:pimeloyl-ACP methyl ester carboxylesterase
MPFAENGGVKIRWESSGAGRPVLLIMGLGYTLDMWHRLAPVLAERRRVVAFDNRGVGESDVPEGAYSIPDMAADAAAVLDDAGVARCDVIGVSMGGVIAQELALSYPERVRSLVLACTTCGGPEAESAEPEVLEILQARATMSVEEGIRAMIPFVYGPDTPVDRIEEDLAIRMRTYPTAQGYLGQLSGVLGYDISERIGAIRVPTLVVHGESDRLVPPSNGRLVASRIPGARLAVLPGASHIFLTDLPEESARVVVEFLDEVHEKDPA